MTLLQIPSPALAQSSKLLEKLQGISEDCFSVENIAKDVRKSLHLKHSSSYGGDGSTAIQKHFAELWEALSELGMLEVTAKAYTKGLITGEVKKTISSVNGTSEEIKAHLLLSAIEGRIRSDQNAFDTFVDILRSESAYEHLADKLTS